MMCADYDWNIMQLAWGDQKHLLDDIEKLVVNKEMLTELWFVPENFKSMVKLEELTFIMDRQL